MARSGELMRNELFRTREPRDFTRADWVYGADHLPPTVKGTSYA